MFIYTFQSEWLKRKRSLASRMIITGAFFTPVVIIVARLMRKDYLTVVYADPAFWKHLWSSAWESMAVFLLPLGAVLLTSLLTQLEFKNNTWKQVHTLPLRLSTIYFTKLSVILVMLLQFILLFTVGVLISGYLPALLTGTKIQALSFSLIGQFLNEDLSYFICLLPIVVSQYTISLFYKNFLVPVGIGFIGWVSALSMLSWRYALIFPYTYVIQRYLHSTGKGGLTVSVTGLTYISLAWFILITVTGYLLYQLKKEKG